MLPWPCKRCAGRQRATSCSGPGAGTTRRWLRRDTGLSPPRARTKRTRRGALATPTGQASDWPSSTVPSRFSHDSHLDPRSFQGHSMQLGRLFDQGGRALDRVIIFCVKCGAVYWERADALCRSCREHPGGRPPQLRKLRSGLLPNRRHPGWTVENVRRPSLAEAPTLVARSRPHPRSNVLPHRQRLWAAGHAFPRALSRWTLQCSAGTRDSLRCWCRSSLSRPRAELARSLKRRTHILQGECSCEVALGGSLCEAQVSPASAVEFRSVARTVVSTINKKQERIREIERERESV